MAAWVALLVRGWVPAETEGVWGVGGLLRPRPHPRLLGSELRICLQLPHKHEETLAALTTTRTARECGCSISGWGTALGAVRLPENLALEAPEAAPWGGRTAASSRLGVATAATYILKDIIFSNNYFPFIYIPYCRKDIILKC